MQVSYPKLNESVFASLPVVQLRVRRLPTKGLLCRSWKTNAIVHCLVLSTTRVQAIRASQHCDDLASIESLRCSVTIYQTTLDKSRDRSPRGSGANTSGVEEAVIR